MDANTLDTLKTIAQVINAVASLLSALTALIGTICTVKTRSDAAKRKSVFRKILFVVLLIAVLFLAAFLLKKYEAKKRAEQNTAQGGEISAASAPASSAPAASAHASSQTPVATTEAVKEAYKPGIHSYEFIQDNCTWKEAQEKAAARGGHLVCFETSEEFDYVIKRMEKDAPGLYYMRIGARRNSKGTEYFWVDKTDSFYGECLNDPDSWCSSIWDSGEPTITWKGSAEDCCVVRYNWNLKKWTMIDVGNKVAESLNQDIVGFIVEYE